MIRATNIERGQIVDNDMMYVDPADIPIGRDAILRAGEIIVVRSGAYTADSAIVTEDYAGSISGYDMVVTVRREALPSFVALALLSTYLRDHQLIVASTRSAQPHLNAEELGTSVLLLPPISEQATIACYLDHAGSRIQRYINAKERLIELLTEQKQAIINQVVTRGLDPNVPLKPSGIEWLGDVPAHWNLVRNGRLFAQRNETGFPDLPILEVSLRTGVDVRNFGISDRKQIMSVRSSYKRAAKGDLTYNMMRMWQGAVGVAPVDGLVSPAYVIAKPLPGTVARFFSALFRTRAYMAEVDKHSRGIVKDRNRLYWEDFKQMTTPCPPPEEQVAIVEYLGRATSDIDDAISRARRQTELMQEYRTRLIADVVTGKLDVRGAVADEVEVSIP